MEQEDCCFFNYADDTTPYVVANNTARVIENLTIITQKLYTWFANNQMKVNHDKCHLILSTQKEANIQFANTATKCSKSKRLLGIVLDNKLKFEKHVESICPKAGKKLNTLARVTSYMELPKRRILMHMFFKSQFSYCPAVWMFHNPSLNNKINPLHERCLRIICNEKYSNFEKLLAKDNSVSIHYNNVHTLAIEMYKVANGLSPDIMNDIFKLRENTHYNLRYASQFLFDPIHSVLNGSESASCLGPKIWERIPFEIKNINSLVGFKKEIRKWKPANCPCRICKVYIPNLGFI